MSLTSRFNHTGFKASQSLQNLLLFPRLSQALHDRFTAMDTDNSGTLSMSEFIQFWEGLRAALSNEKAYKRLLEDCVADFNISVCTIHEPNLRLLCGFKDIIYVYLG